MKTKVFVILLFFIFISGIVYAEEISFGSVGYNQRIMMIPGEVKEFKLSFFNYGDTPLVVEIEKTGSNEIKTSINPKYFVLENSKNVINPMGEEEWVVLGDNYVKAVPVHIALKVPDNISELTTNYHVVRIVAKAMIGEESSGRGTKERISQAREYTYFITVPGNIHAKTMEEYNESLKEFYTELQSNTSGNGGEGWGKINVRKSSQGEEQQRGQLPTGFFSLGGEKEESGSFFYVFVIALIIILYLIYRKFRR